MQAGALTAGEMARQAALPETSEAKIPRELIEQIWRRTDRESAYLSQGCRYFDGLGVPKDLRQAVKYFSFVADLVPTSIQYDLGVGHQKGEEGLPCNDKTAFFWFLKAAEDGHGEAQYNVGLSYLKGLRIGKDEKKAAEWFQRAADQGVAKARTELGLLYGKGAGVLRDDAKSLELHQLAAKGGDPDAMYYLGCRYSMGQGGVSRNDGQAHGWFSSAAASGHEGAQYQLNYFKHGNGKWPVEGFRDALK